MQHAVPMRRGTAANLLRNTSAWHARSNGVPNGHNRIGGSWREPSRSPPSLSSTGSTDGGTGQNMCKTSVRYDRTPASQHRPAQPRHRRTATTHTNTDANTGTQTPRVSRREARQPRYRHRHRCGSPRQQTTNLAERRCRHRDCLSAAASRRRRRATAPPPRCPAARSHPRRRSRTHGGCAEARQPLHNTHGRTVASWRRARCTTLTPHT